MSSSETLKRTNSDRSSTSSMENQPARKQPKRQIHKLDITSKPGKNASASEWGEFLLKQLVIMNNNIDEIAKSTDYACDEAAEAVQQCKTLSASLNVVQNSMSQILSENTELKNENVQLKESLLKLEAHQRRNNLVFEGIKDNANEDEAQCLKSLCDKLTSIDPNFNVTDVKITRCHRIGSYQAGKNRAIIANFWWFGDRKQILKEKKSLPTGVYVHEDLPSAYESRRRALRPILNLALSKEKYRGKAHLSMDKLVINKKVYTFAPKNNLHELPDDLRPELTAQKSNPTTLIFFGQHSPMSNFHPSVFKINGVTYSCGEQFIQSSKARLFGDDVICSQIMRTKNPYEMKSHGYRVQNFDQNTWENNSLTVGKECALQKFAQNPHLKKFLIDTRDLIPAESSTDPVWGTGVRLKEPGALDSDTWVGKSIMGDALMAARDILRAAT